MAPGPDPARTRYDVAPLEPTHESVTVVPLTPGPITTGALGAAHGGAGAGDALPIVRTNSFDGALQPYALLAITRM